MSVLKREEEKEGKFGVTGDLCTLVWSALLCSACKSKREVERCKHGWQGRAGQGRAGTTEEVQVQVQVNGSGEVNVEPE